MPYATKVSTAQQGARSHRSEFPPHVSFPRTARHLIAHRRIANYCSREAANQAARPTQRSPKNEAPLLLLASFAVAVRLSATAPLVTTVAQARAASGSIAGRVRSAPGGPALPGVTILLDGRRVGLTAADGRYRIGAVERGQHVLGLRRIGLRPLDVPVSVGEGEARELDVVYPLQPIVLGEVSVVAASRRPQRLLDAPAAVTVVAPERVADLAQLGQTPLLVADLPGVHVRQSGAFEFNLNARGFNTTTARRTLVLIDGRDVSVPLLGSQEWSDFTLLDDATRVELVRGPGSALYGANAFGGVLAITTATVRQSQGTRLSVSGGSPFTTRADVSRSVMLPGNRWGLRGSAGAMRGMSWDESRTDSLALAREYARAGVPTPRAPAPGYEFLPLPSQSTGAPVGVSAIARGDVDPVTGWYAQGRVDRYGSSGRTLTAEAGTAHTEGLLSTVNTGRSLTQTSNRPWARVALSDSVSSVFAYYSGRFGDGTALAAPVASRDRSGVLHVEGQYDWRLPRDRGRLTLGGSARDVFLDTDGTLLSADGDGSHTQYGAVFSQLDVALASRLRAVVAARTDISSRDATQFSPKFGLVFAPSSRHSIRATVARGYLVPPLLGRFLELTAGPPLDLRGLEAGLRASPLGPVLAGVPAGTLFTNSAAVPLLALGADDLGTERNTTYELGWKAQVRTLFLSAHLYHNRMDGFLSPLLPGGDLRRAAWSAPAAVPEAARAALEGAVLGAAGRGLTRLANGSTAFVLSGGNAGRARERGVELEAQWRPDTRWTFDANYAGASFSIDAGSFIPGDTVVANTPRHTANASAAFTASDGTRARVGLRAASAFDWRSAVWVGRVPSMASLDGSVSRPLTPTLRASLVGTNLLDQQRYQFFGGSLVRRRVLASLTWRP